MRTMLKIFNMGFSFWHTTSFKPLQYFNVGLTWNAYGTTPYAIYSLVKFPYKVIKLLINLMYSITFMLVINKEIW